MGVRGEASRKLFNLLHLYNLLHLRATLAIERQTVAEMPAEGNFVVANFRFFIAF